ncbi:MAG: phage holin family protein [Betaproteobacteria bacterium]|nr:phage holin family protein [Betaproteobacteria bacterium]
MPEKDPTTFSMLTYAWVFALSAWGGAVNFVRKVRNGSARPFNVMELVGELMTSAFAGIITFWLCNAADIQPLITAALVGISGHMGSRAIYHFETWAEGRLPGRG